MKNLPKEKRFALLAGFGLIAVGLVRLALPHDDFPVGQPKAEISFTIEDGATGSVIAQNLFEQGVIKKSKKFVSEFTKDKRAVGISPGVHKIHTHITSRLAIAELLDQSRILNSVKIIEGTTLADALNTLRKNSHISPKTFKNGDIINPFDSKNPSIEGLLYPANYSFEPNTSMSAALAKMVSKFESSDGFMSLKNHKGKFTPYQLLTIASMVQIEGDLQSYAKVAQVIFNRLTIGMPLQLNSTVQYAAGTRGKISLSNKATQIKSPYNTYRNSGLPPTPISNPGNLAIKATLNPSPGDWLYFITVKPGDTRFTKSFDEFSKWNTEFNINNAKGLFK